MERTQRSVTASIVLIAILHLVGVVGLSLDNTRPLFQSIFPLNLLVTAGVLAIFHRLWTQKFGYFVFGIFWAGFLIEYIGVHTGVIFGHYFYGETLGFKVGGIPIVMGLLWVILVYMSGVIAQPISGNIWVRASISALLILVMDLLLEPLAFTFDLWNWNNVHPPLQNYLAWYILGWVMSYIFHSIYQEKSNPLAFPAYAIMVFSLVMFLVVGA
ncbi:carotenoid biosynthesis protein [Pontibacter sp. G13]|uniref:carotenoid biosynthesis protein n=1 Tax=Pontibacter sp. G13 TaxID=3074898 RepID=UPI002889A032|nr:carotenoid biosynthesis protein [Pontibacter sp. G13]WNJ18197.1 carotenoid biosynthesis protein [Pontibacter sp. G13]